MLIFLQNCYGEYHSIEILNELIGFNPLFQRRSQENLLQKLNPLNFICFSSISKEAETKQCSIRMQQEVAFLRLSLAAYSSQSFILNSTCKQCSIQYKTVFCMTICTICCLWPKVDGKTKAMFQTSKTNSQQIKLAETFRTDQLIEHLIVSYTSIIAIICQLPQPN